MKISTFQEDLLGLQDFAHRLQNYIETEHDFVEGSLVIALSSKYGSGKTTFLNMWRSSLESAEHNEDKLLVISLNAWESDYYGDPLFSIVSALVDSIEKAGITADTLLEAAKDVGWFATALGAQVVNKFTGIDPVAAGNVAGSKKAKRTQPSQYISDTFTIYKERKTAMESLKEAIRKIVHSSKPKALFFVDELDRCRPDYAIEYLETIKHIFDIKGAVFLLAADRKQLENSAKTAFGPELDFEEYYRKFVHREVTLPLISETGYQNLAKNYVNYYLEREGSRFCFMRLEQSRIRDISEFVGGLKLTPRQIQEVFRTLGHIFETSEDKRGRLRWCLAVGSIAMAAVKIGAPKIFHLLGNRQFEPAEAVDFLRQTIVIHYKVDWWFNLFLTGGGLLVRKGESPIDLMKRAGLIEESETTPDQINLSQWYDGWGDFGWDEQSPSRFKQIYEKIQHIDNWG